MNKLKKKVYIADSFRQLALINQLAAQLEAAGYTRTFDWGKAADPATLSGLRDIAELEIQGIKDADFMVFVFPGGKGANVEFGVATALQKPIYLLDTTGQLNDPADTCTFYEMDHVKKFHGSATDFIDFIVKNELVRKS
ncbi:nucleoside 2-deoxyribosyltransferase [Lacticaseibacillus jixianensis]|uniref:Nucleoside 2-deoxyribosyltransferase n=1 Tax=Lacticaseibacillus jixianensis TaxID=2486012 RepID=A0ABW4B812_9LACO|nr:nucleoside 2-deoxyribosyltransferase [Lacticaseibacillus jixianensis]